MSVSDATVPRTHPVVDVENPTVSAVPPTSPVTASAMSEPDLNYPCPQCAAPDGVECDQGCPSTRLRVAEAEVAALTEQVATLTARLTELAGADIALEDAIAEMRRMRDERDEWKEVAGNYATALVSAEDELEVTSERLVNRALAAEATVDRYEVALERIVQVDIKHTGGSDLSEIADGLSEIAIAALTRTEPGEGT